MKKGIFVFGFALLSLSVFGQSERPKLVVGIVVDQMRQDYIYRYWDTFGENGFKKLVNEGFMLRNAHYNYIPTNTGPGHAAIYSGTTPANNGIIGNSWYDKNLENYVNCVGDTSVNTVGAKNSRGFASPHRLISSTITDELKLASQGRSKVISVSIKDRGAILPAGHSANGAFWYDAETGNFVSSTYYMEKLPRWVDKFNKEKRSESYAEQTWELLLDKDKYSASGPDNSPYEVVLRGKSSPVFPYNLSELDEQYESYDYQNATPFGNQIVTDFAVKAIDEAELGSGRETDFLAISYSSTDYAGHAWGPNSVEVQDMYLRLDKNIADLIKHLNSSVGSDNYTIFLTSDHGVVDVPARLDTLKIPAGYLRANLAKEINDHLRSALQKNVQFVKTLSNGQVFLDHVLLPGESLITAQNLVARYLREREGIYMSYTASEMRNSDFNSGGLKGLLTRGFNQQRSGDVVYSLYPAHSTSSSEKGTGHGTGFTYDTHIPILWYGKGINKGVSSSHYTVTDIAPTLSVLLNIRFPNAATGQPIVEVLK